MIHHEMSRKNLDIVDLNLAGRQLQLISLSFVSHTTPLTAPSLPSLALAAALCDRVIFDWVGEA
jgi:hypothetical protein